MDFQKITLTPDGQIYLKWISIYGNIWESWIAPELVPKFIEMLIKELFRKEKKMSHKRDPLPDEPDSDSDGEDDEPGN